MLSVCGGLVRTYISKCVGLLALNTKYFRLKYKRSANIPQHYPIIMYTKELASECEAS